MAAIKLVAARIPNTALFGFGWHVPLLFVAMDYDSIAALPVELFPMCIRYTTMSLHHHVGNGWFGLPADHRLCHCGGHCSIYYGLWYPIIGLFQGRG